MVPVFNRDIDTDSLPPPRPHLGEDLKVDPADVELRVGVPTLQREALALQDGLRGPCDEQGGCAWTQITHTLSSLLITA